MKSRDQDTKENLKNQYENDQQISTCMSTNDHDQAKDKILQKSLADKARDNLK